MQISLFERPIIRFYPKNNWSHAFLSFMHFMHSVLDHLLQLGKLIFLVEFQLELNENSNKLVIFFFMKINFKPDSFSLLNFNLTHQKRIWKFTSVLTFHNVSSLILKLGRAAQGLETMGGRRRKRGN